MGEQAEHGGALSGVGGDTGTRGHGDTGTRGRGDTANERISDQTFRALRTTHHAQHIVQSLAIVVTQRARPALDDVPARHPDGRETGQADGADTGAAVLDAEHGVARLERNAQTNPSRLGVEPGVRLGRKLTQRAGLAAAQRKAGGDNRIVEVARVAQAQRPKRGHDLRPGFLVQAGGHRARS